MIIGTIGKRYGIVATAAHVLEDIEKDIAYKGVPRHLQYVDEYARFTEGMLQYIWCGIALEGGREVFARAFACEVPRKDARRDTGLVFVGFTENMVDVPDDAFGWIPVDLSPPPQSPQTLFVGGFDGSGPLQLMRNMVGPGEVWVPERRPIVYEGFYEPDKPGCFQVLNPTLTHTAPVKGGMSGGPTFCVRRFDDLLDRFVALGTNVGETPEENGYSHLMRGFYAHRIALPPETGDTEVKWIPFIEAVYRDYVHSLGVEAGSVQTYEDENGLPQFDVYQWIKTERPVLSYIQEAELAPTPAGRPFEWRIPYHYEVPLIGMRVTIAFVHTWDYPSNAAEDLATYRAWNKEVFERKIKAELCRLREHLISIPGQEIPFRVQAPPPYQGPPRPANPEPGTPA
ncbi:MAG TPA: hypothetical protein VGI91_09060 [Steroidobacteraceae bacterium]